MKRNAIVRIVLCSIALVILLGMLGIGIGIRMYMIDFAVEGSSDGYSVVTKTPTPVVESDDTVSTRLDADGIREIEIDWAAGCITILPQEGATQITVIEPKQTQEKYQMHCRQAGSKLSIEFWQEDIFIHSTDISKDLTITVPADWACDSLEIDTAAASIQTSGLTIRNVEIDSASGICNFENCAVEKFDIDTASGNVTFQGTLDRLDFDAASANCHLILNNVPYQIDMDSMSGDLTLNLPEEAGFTMEMDALSGDFTSDFATTMQNGRHVCGNGSCRITLSALSGDIDIRKHTAHHTHDDSCYAENSTCPDHDSLTATHHTHDESCYAENSTCPDRNSQHHN